METRAGPFVHAWAGAGTVQSALGSLVLVLAFTAVSPAWAGEPRFTQRRFSHVADKQPLRELLRTFAAAQGWVLILPPGLDDPVSGRFALAAPSFWDVITSGHNLQWYFDGQAMHVTPGNDMRTEVVPMAAETYTRFLASLDRLDITDRRFRPSYDADAAVARLSGPPRFVELASGLAASIDGEALRDREQITRVFLLKSALAANTSVSLGGQAVELEGVASVLRRVMGAGDGEGLAAARRQTGLAAPAAERLSPATGPGERSGSDALRLGQRAPATGDPAVSQGPAPVVVQPPTRRQPAQPRIEAEASINAVIVRDRPARMADYQALIQQLDKARTLVEIESRMVEVEKDQMESLGIDWQISNARGSGATFNTGAAAQANNPEPQILTTLIQGTASRLLSRIRALESEGRARVVMTPKVLALDGTQAVIESTETAYVKVAGNLEANLFAVSTGAALRIQPSVLHPQAQGPRRVRLAILVEDGSFTSARADATPTVQRTRVFAHSELTEGDTLVIAGLSDARESAADDRVPGLHRLPLIGGLFRSNSGGASSRQRLYMLTARVASTEGADLAQFRAPPAPPAAPEDAPEARLPAARR